MTKANRMVPLVSQSIYLQDKCYILLFYLCLYDSYRDRQSVQTDRAANS